MNKGPNATLRLVRRQNHAGTTVSWTTVQREKNSHAYKLSSNVQTACSTDSLNNSRSRRDVMSHVIYLTTRPPLMFGGKSSDKLSMKRNQ